MSVMFVEDRNSIKLVINSCPCYGGMQPLFVDPIILYVYF